MRVLFICLARPGFYDAYVHRIKSLKNGLERHGVQTAMLYLGNLPFRKPFLISPVNVPLMRKYLEGFDFVHAGNTGAAYLMGLARAAKRSDAKIVYDVHGNLAEEARLNSRGRLDLTNHFHVLQYSLMEKVALKCSDYFAVCSEAFRDHYLRRGIGRDRIEVVLNGVNVDLFRPRPERPQPDGREGEGPRGPFTITYAGRFQKWQGIGLLLQAAKRLEGEDVRFRVIGPTNGEKAALRARHPNVEFVDFIPNTELVDCLCRSDGLVIPRMSHPALEVAFPTKFAEYVACGVPVVVTDVGDAGRLTRRYRCGLACGTDAESIAGAILELKRCGEAGRRAMGDNGRRLAEDLLDYKKISGTYYDFLRRASC